MTAYKPKARFARKLLCVFLVFGILSAAFSFSAAAGGENEKGTNYPFVFVAGYAGWGQYDRLNNALPYWGRLNGDLIKYLNEQGFECGAASVDPLGSAWDRACELYAQMTGTVVDYGGVHAARYNHKRFGTDYSKKPLLTGWGEPDGSGGINKVNLVGHSFGGATIRLLAQLLADGSPEEFAGTSGAVSRRGVSPLFTGGKADWIHSITTYAAPHNGADSVLVFSPVELITAFDAFKGLEPLKTRPMFKNIYSIGKSLSLLRVKDWGLCDLYVDGAFELNKNLSANENIYYFSFPSDATVESPRSAKRIPDTSVADPLFYTNIYMIGRGTAVTDKGIVIDERWFNNDGVVNTVSTIAPFNEPQRVFDPADISPGIWHIMPTYRGDHAAVIGGLSYAVDINAMYLEQLRLINSL